MWVSSEARRVIDSETSGGSEILQIKRWYPSPSRAAAQAS